MFPLANGETVTRERAQLVPDPYSGESTKRDWTAPDTLIIEGAAIAPSSSSESSTENRTTTTTAMSIYAAPGTDLLPDDRIRARSGLWEVQGDTSDWRNALTGWNPCVEFRVERVSG